MVWQAQPLLERVRSYRPGVPEAALDEIFTPFYRLDASRSQETGGVGLGLTIVKKIVQHHGGWLEIDSMFGKGTVVVTTLPVKAQGRRADAGFEEDANSDAPEKLVDDSVTNGPEEVVSPKIEADFESQ